MMMLRVLLALMLLLPAACQAAERPALSENGLALIPLTITTAEGKSHRFTVEVAATEAQQARGMMFRATLAPDAGMIFPMSPPRYASFWMKNTVIPLDMIFIRADGRIARIAAETTPFSLLPVDSGEPVAAVLELAGGRAAQLGLAGGDKVVWKRR
jgi:uncharacterized membrane protein (UPF0127 family)